MSTRDVTALVTSYSRVTGRARTTMIECTVRDEANPRVVAADIGERRARETDRGVAHVLVLEGHRIDEIRAIYPEGPNEEAHLEAIRDRLGPAWAEIGAIPDFVVVTGATR